MVLVDRTANISSHSAEQVSATKADLAEELSAEKENAHSNVRPTAGKGVTATTAAECTRTEAEGTVTAGAAPRTGQLLTAKTGRQLREEVLQVGKPVKLDVGSQSAFGEVTESMTFPNGTAYNVFVPSQTARETVGAVRAKNPFESIEKASAREELLARLEAAKMNVAKYKDALRAGLEERVTKHDEEKQELDNEFLAKLEVLEERGVEIEAKFAARMEANAKEQIILERKLAMQVQKSKELEQELAWELEAHECDRLTLFKRMDVSRSEMAEKTSALAAEIKEVGTVLQAAKPETPTPDIDEFQ
jgi:hypothetical protein